MDTHRRILSIVRLIPRGQVASYGQIAGCIPGATPRLVGYALHGSGAREDVPWQRVINSKGAISPHAGSAEQRRLLEEEGVIFTAADRIDMTRFGWRGPDPMTLIDCGIEPEAAFAVSGARQSTAPDALSRRRSD